jgi:hypothetical protein
MGWVDNNAIPMSIGRFIAPNRAEMKFRRNGISPMFL